MVKILHGADFHLDSAFGTLGGYRRITRGCRIIWY